MKRQRWVIARLMSLATIILLLSGCVGLPVGGPVVETQVESDPGGERPMSIDPSPPRPGATAAEIAAGFLDAMEASPIRVDVARQFLSAAAQPIWDPERATLVHEGLASPNEVGSTITVSMSEPELLDRRGAWQGVLPASEQTLQFQMVEEEGEFRIADPVDALIVSTTWFEARYQQVSLYFYDRGATILVPEPVFVPLGGQMATSLIDGLLAGPPEELRASGRTFVPSRLSVELSVPVSRDGVADISLLGEAVLPDDDTVERMLAQFAWTLRQVPSIRAFTITIGGQDVRLPSGVTQFPVTGVGQYDSTGSQSSSLLYGLRDGLLVAGEPGELAEVSGPLGEEAFGVESISVNPRGSIVAGVTGEGTSVLVGSVERAVDEPDPDAVREILSGATDLLPPVYDLTDRLWLVDRTPEGAHVSYLVGDRPIRIEIPDVSGRQVREFLVSRDATRFVAVVRSRGVDEVHVGRLRVSENGKVIRAAPTRRLVFDGSERLRVVDLAWASPTSISLLSPITDNAFEALTVAVDGAPTGLEMRSDSLTGPVRELVSSPVPGALAYVRTKEGLAEIGARNFVTLDERISTLQYAG